MAKRRKRKSSRCLNPQYSAAVFDIVNDFIDKLNDTVSTGEWAVKKIKVKTGNVPVAAMILKITETMEDVGERIVEELTQ